MLEEQISLLYEALLAESNLTDTKVVPEISAVLATATGAVRKQNQDRLLATFAEAVGEGTEPVLAVVADGIGGRPNGAEAASLTVASVAAFCAEYRHLAPVVRLRRALSEASRRVHREFRGDGGAAVVAVLLAGDQYAVGSLGDSRAYRVDEDRRLHLLTRDDTLAAHARELPASIDPSHLNSLMQYSGMEEEPDPHVSAFSAPTALLLLTTDGVHGVLGDGQLQFIVHHARSTRTAVDTILRLVGLAGAPDNATVLALALRGPSVPSGHHRTHPYWTAGTKIVTPRTRGSSRLPEPQVREPEPQGPDSKAGDQAAGAESVAKRPRSRRSPKARTVEVKVTGSPAEAAAGGPDSRKKPRKPRKKSQEPLLFPSEEGPSGGEGG